MFPNLARFEILVNSQIFVAVNIHTYVYVYTFMYTYVCTLLARDLSLKLRHCVLTKSHFKHQQNNILRGLFLYLKFTLWSPASYRMKSCIPMRLFICSVLKVYLFTLINLSLSIIVCRVLLNHITRAPFILSEEVSSNIRWSSTFWAIQSSILFNSIKPVSKLRAHW